MSLNFSSSIDGQFMKDLNEINTGLNKFANNAEKASDRIDKAFERALSEAPQDVKELNEALKMQVVTVKQLEAEYRKAEQAVSNMAPGTAKSQMAGDLKKQVLAIEEEKAALEGLKKAQEQLPPATKRISMELEHMRNTMARMRVDGKQNTEEYKVLEQQMGKLGTAYREATAQQNALTTGATQIGGIITGIQGLMGAYAMGSGVVSLFVKDNAKLEAIQTRMQSIMAILMGMQQVANTLHSTSAFRITTVSKVTELWNLANLKVATGLTRLGIGMGVANVAAKALTATLTLGLGVAITAAVMWIDKLIEKNRQAKKEQEEYSKKVVEGVAGQIAVYSKLSTEFNKVGNTIKDKEKFVQKYQDSFKELGVSIGTVNDAENLFKVNGDAFVESLYLRAEAAANYQMAVEKFKEVATSKMEYEQGKKDATTYKQEGGRTVKVFRESQELRDLEQSYKDAQNAAQELIEKSLALETKAAAKLQSTGVQGTGTAEAKQGTIAYYEELIKKKKEERRVTSLTAKEYQTLQKDIEAYQSSIDAISKVQDSGKALKDLEIQNQKKINAIKEQAQNTLTTDVELKEQLLLQEYKYLRKKEQLTKETIDKLKIQEQIIGVSSNLQALEQDKEQRLQEKQEELDEILVKYANHEQLKQQIIKEANEDIAVLEADNIDGRHAETIKRIMQTTKKALREADIEFLKASDGLSGIFEDAKHQSIKEVKEMVDAITSLLSMVERPDTFTSENALGLTEEQFVILQQTPEVLALIKERLKEIQEQAVKVENSFDILTRGFQEVSEGQLLQGIQTMQQGAVALNKAFQDMSQIFADLGANNQALQNTAKSMEQISKAGEEIDTGAQIGGQIGGGYGALIGGVVGYVKYAVSRVAEYRKINKEMKEDFQRTTDSITQNIAFQERSLTGLQKKYETIYGADSFGQGMQASADSIRKSEQALQQYMSTIQGYDVATNFTGKDKSTEYQKLATLFPELIDAQGRLNTAVGEGVLESEALSGEQKKVLAAALDTTYAIEEAYTAMRQYLQDIFGGTSDAVVQAFQTMYEGGTDAMDSLNESFSNMIEQFTRDSIQAAFLQPYLEEMQKANEATMGLYKDKKISSGGLQEQIISTLGEFYGSLNEIQPAILQAYENADKLAEQAGFSRAFDSEATGKEAKSTAGMLQQAITEETGTMLVGRLGAIMLSNERMSNYMADGLEYAIQNLVMLDKIKSNTDYLPEIAENTKKTYQKLDTL